MGISKLQVKGDHVLQLRKAEGVQMERQLLIEHLQTHRNHKLTEVLMERQRPIGHQVRIEHQPALQQLIGHQLTTGHHLPVHQIDHRHPDRWDHLVLLVRVARAEVVLEEAEVEGDKI